MAALRKVSRRAALTGGLTAFAALWGCSDPGRGTQRQFTLPPQESQRGAEYAPLYSDSVDALCDVILPAEFDDQGTRTAPGAREARVDQVLTADALLTFAVALGALPEPPAGVRAAIGSSGETLRAFLNAGLDGLAALERPLVAYRDLPREAQERVAERAFDDERLRPAMALVRTACMAAYCGGVASDVGMQALGFPPFEDREAGLAVSGYPRTTAGRLIHVESEDLAKLAAEGQLDDYSYRVRPAATAGDDLTLLLDDNGDLR